jgi:hypothetical protein
VMRLRGRTNGHKSVTHPLAIWHPHALSRGNGLTRMPSDAPIVLRADRGEKEAARPGRPLVEAIKHLTARQAQLRDAMDRLARGRAPCRNDVRAVGEELMPWRWRNIQKLSIHITLALVGLCIGMIIGWLLFMAIRS